MSEPSTEPSTEPGTEAADSAAEQPEEFANRAARRAAKGQTGAKPQEQFRKGQLPTGRGAVQSPRQYGTRRSG